MFGIQELALCWGFEFEFRACNVGFRVGRRGFRHRCI